VIAQRRVRAHDDRIPLPLRVLAVAHDDVFVHFRLRSQNPRRVLIPSSLQVPQDDAIERGGRRVVVLRVRRRAFVRHRAGHRTPGEQDERRRSVRRFEAAWRAVAKPRAIVDANEWTIVWVPSIRPIDGESSPRDKLASREPERSGERPRAMVDVEGQVGES